MLPKHLPARATITLALATLVVVLAGIVPQQLEAQSRRYRTRDGGTLPFATDAQILLALREGEIVKEETLGSGTTGVKRLEIRYEGIVMRAAFRHIDVYERNIRLRDGSNFSGFYDRFSAECAAYELGQMLGLDMIPPAVLRRVGSQLGSVQLWVEDAMTEGERTRRGLRPPDSRAWRGQQATMRAFDALIANSDRNTGNSLIDADWNLWLIDHSRTFQIPRGKRSFAQVNQISASFWEALRALDHDSVRSRLGDYLEPPQLRSLFDRHEELIAHIESLIEARGREAVVIE